MFLVFVESWADGSPWRLDGEVFTDLDQAIKFASRFKGLFYGSWGWAGEQAFVQTMRLDGDSAQSYGWATL